MHLWPSMRLRDSFKNAYIKKLECNLNRMKSEKQQQQSQNQQKLLDDKEDDDNNSSDNSKTNGFLVLCRELLMVLSCCYCCFCCGENGLLHFFCFHFRDKRERERETYDISALQAKDWRSICGPILLKFQYVDASEEGYILTGVDRPDSSPFFWATHTPFLALMMKNADEELV